MALITGKTIGAASANSKKCYLFHDEEEGRFLALHNPAQSGSLRLYSLDGGESRLYDGKALKQSEVLAFLETIRKEGKVLPYKPIPSDEVARWVEYGVASWK